jgi:hypothetical protein
VGKNFARNVVEHFIPHVDGFLVLVEPLLRLLHEGEGKEIEPDACWCDIFYDNGVAQLKKVLKVHACVLTRQTTKLVCLHHRYEASPELKISSARVDSGPNGHIGNSGVE